VVPTGEYGFDGALYLSRPRQARVGGRGCGRYGVPMSLPPLMVLSDHTILLETASPLADEARDALLGFAELVKSPEYVHTWRLTPLSLWNAASAGHRPDQVIGDLARFSRYPLPDVVVATIRDKMGRYGRVRLLRDGEHLRLEVDEPAILVELRATKSTADLLGPALGDHAARVLARRRGELKQALLAVGHPVEDLAGYDDGEQLALNLRGTTRLREYQLAAVDAFLGGPGGGNGVVVLPCGAGKTLVGVGVMARLGMRTLILCTGHTALEQWRAEVLRHTTLRDDQVKAWVADEKAIGPVTLTTYQLLTWRPRKTEIPPHFRLFHEANWGLVIYDEVHLLPAPVFREAALLQARRRLGLTATLVREDGHEGDVFALVGPKRFDLPWKTLEHQGWIALATCVELRVPFSEDDHLKYAAAPAKQRFTLATRNPRKGAVLEQLLLRHADVPVLVLGTDLPQLDWLSRRFELTLVSGETRPADRDRAFADFREGRTRVLALSKVGNFSVDLPNAAVAIQVSGTFGSRQEEAQRLGRVLRPKPGDNKAVFYSLVTADSVEQDYAERRQLFLAEQGYPYHVEHAQ
jgi:DNA excision repair protein ERCC-3